LVIIGFNVSLVMSFFFFSTLIDNMGRQDY
jgi:hypothetical protein